MVDSLNDDLRYQEVRRFSEWCGRRGTLVKSLDHLARIELSNPGQAVTAIQILKAAGYEHPQENQKSGTAKKIISRLRDNLSKYYANRLPLGPHCLIAIVNSPGGGYRCQFYVRDSTSESSNRSELLNQFWKGFSDAGSPPLVVYGNNEFQQQSDGDLREYQTALRAADDPGEVPDHPNVVLMTGTGEVSAAASLQATLSNFGVRAEFIRSRRASGVEERNVIYLGSSLSNRFLGSLDRKRVREGKRRFLFEERSRMGVKTYCLVDSGGNVKGVRKRALTRHMSKDGFSWTDYALICRLTKKNGHRDLILAGTTTHGTQAATEFVCREDTLHQLLRSLGPDSSRDFEAVLNVPVDNGIPGPPTLLDDWIV